MKESHLEFYDNDSEVKICFSTGFTSNLFQTKLETLANILYFFGVKMIYWEEACEMITELQNSALPFQKVNPDDETSCQIDFCEIANTIYYSFGYMDDSNTKSDISDDLRQEIDDHLKDKTSLN